MDTLTNIINDQQVSISYIKLSEDKIYFKAKEVCEYLEYKDTKKAIKEHVQSKHKMTLKSLKSMGGKISTLENLHPDIIFISEAGLYLRFLTW